MNTEFKVGDRVILHTHLREWNGITGTDINHDTSYDRGQPFVRPDTNRPDGFEREPFYAGSIGWWKPLPIPKPPKFNSIEEADAWLEQHSPKETA